MEFPAKLAFLFPVAMELAMNQSAFEAELRAAGYTQIEIKAIDPRPANEAHSHDYGVRGLVLEGAFTVKQADRSVTYLPGEIFTVAAGQSHTEEIGPQGARVFVGRKY
jgi:quercetin dioxygenase-like cupin family protein